jgi:hypothetical protein
MRDKMREKSEKREMRKKITKNMNKKQINNFKEINRYVRDKVEEHTNKPKFYPSALLLLL